MVGIRLIGVFSLSVLFGGSWLGLARAEERQENYADYLPPGVAKALVKTQCTVCHDLRPVVTLRKSRLAWEGIILTMVDQGASLQPEEADQVIAYLSDVLGSQAPPLVDVNVAEEAELTKLPGITPLLAAQIIAHRTTRGPFRSRDEVQAVVGFDSQAFEKTRWYTRAGPVAAQK